MYRKGNKNPKKRRRKKANKGRKKTPVYMYLVLANDCFLIFFFFPIEGMEEGRGGEERKVAGWVGRREESRKSVAKF